MKRLIIGFSVCVLVVAVIGVSNYQAEEDPDQKKINEAIDLGVKFLLTKPIKGREAELMVLTLAHCDVKVKDPKMQEGINYLLSNKLSATYNVALTAMALETIDRFKYQRRIAECAQALVNYQCANGQWNYPSVYSPGQDAVPIITGEPAQLREVITGDKATKPKEGTLKKIIIKRDDIKKPPPEGDNSNTQFALLGLRAAARSGCVIPDETWKKAADFLTSAQLGDGGWGYFEAIRKSPIPVTSYGGMTCAGICALAIVKSYLKEDITNNTNIQSGLSWLASNLTFDSNPGKVMVVDRSPLAFLYYYIYGIERVGAVLGIEKIGSHEWYKEGARWLLAQQKHTGKADDGSWNQPSDDAFSNDVADTCFALLFLKRATPKLELKPIETK